MAKKLTKEIAYKEFQKIFRGKPFVLFGTGMSCAIDNKFGMASLKECLLDKLAKGKLNSVQQTEWDSVIKSLNSSCDFETSMNNVKDDVLINEIVGITGDFVSKLDCEYSQEILNGNKNWPASSLFKKLVDKLPGTDRELHVATPNYDMLAEYAFEREQIPYINGFCGGVVRQLDWEQSKRSITYSEKVPHGKKFESVTREKKHIALYKVHGSLNLFLTNDILIENNALLYMPRPKGTERLIITPGLSKYERLHQFRNELLGKFDNSVEKHNFFLFLGFGFNDKQLNTRTILDKLKNQKYNGLIITKDTNDRINKLSDEAENSWLIYQSGSGTLIKNKKYSDPLFLQNEELWKVETFTKKILGD
ncbi:SIR2 family protein [bacterium]|nr:SIR2 family protein [bacterium]